MFTAGGLNITARTPFGSPCASIEAAKEEIRALLLQPPSSVTDFERFRLDYLVKYLEATHVPIHTGQFLSLALGGSWTLKYSNVILSRPEEEEEQGDAYQYGAVKSANNHNPVSTAKQSKTNPAVPAEVSAKKTSAEAAAAAAATMTRMAST